MVDLLIDAGGKRLRPTVALLSSRLCEADADRAIFAAAAVEFLHTASLVHDDLIDDSPVRRGVDTLNSHRSPGTTVLVGDYVFARAAHLASQTGSVRWMQRFAETLMEVCSGEVRQMFDGQRHQISLQEYEQRILAKTASLMSLSAEAGPALAEADETVVDKLRTYGEQLGLAFQVVDDVLDFVGDERALGKSVGSDLQRGVVTLPLLLFLQSEPSHPAVRQALEEDPSDHAVQAAVQAVSSSSAIKQALATAQGYADRAKVALQGFPRSRFVEALVDLADFTVSRAF
jgi:geranylgeranyl pyrophosphate synthase